MTHRPWRKRLIPGLLPASVFLLLLSACADPTGPPADSVYPTFSFVGAPNRDVTYDLSITGPGMRPITLNEIGPTTGSVRVEVPAGPDRLIDMRARNDIYSGSTTRTLRAGRTENVRLQLLPGPVFVSQEIGSPQTEPTVLRVIRDLSIPESAVVEASDGRARGWGYAGGVAFDLAYDHRGRLWTLDPMGQRIILANPSDPNEPEEGSYIDIGGEGEADGTSIALAASPANPYVYFGAENRVHRVDISDIENPIISTPIEQLFEPNGSANGIVHGLAVDSSENLFVLAAQDWLSNALELHKYEGDPLTITGAITIPSQTLPQSRYDGQPPFSDFSIPVGDLRVVASVIMVVVAANEPGDEVIFLYDKDNLGGLNSYGEYDPSSADEHEKFWGPRRFVATRDEDEVIIIDQKNDDTFGPPIDGFGRLVRFDISSPDGRQTFEVDDMGFFITTFC